MSNQQQNLEGLLRFAIQSGSHGDKEVNRVLSENDRKWLDDAIQNITAGGGQVNIVNELKKSLGRVDEILDVTEKGSDECELVYGLLENLAENCENHDIAKIFEQIGGFNTMFKCLRNSNPEIRWRAFEVIGNCAQNNEHCQDALLANNGLKICMEITDRIDEDNQVRIKSFYAVSCIVRSSTKNINYFETNDGFSVVVRILQSRITKLEMKVIFFLRNVCIDDNNLIQVLLKHGIPTELISMLTTLGEEELQKDKMGLLENILSLLCLIVQDSKDVLEEINVSSFSNMLRKLEEGIKKKFSEYEEIFDYLHTLKALLYNNESEMER